eukprot:1061715-Rhodomonas_salina.2
MQSGSLCSYEKRPNLAVILLQYYRWYQSFGGQNRTDSTDCGVKYTLFCTYRTTSRTAYPSYVPGSVSPSTTVKLRVYNYAPRDYFVALRQCNRISSWIPRYRKLHYRRSTSTGYPGYGNHPRQIGTHDIDMSKIYITSTQLLK